MKKMNPLYSRLRKNLRRLWRKSRSLIENLTSVLTVGDIVEENRENYIQMILIELERKGENGVKPERRLDEKTLRLADLLKLEYQNVENLKETSLDAKLESSLENLRKISSSENAYSWVMRGQAKHHGTEDENEKREFLKSVIRETYFIYVSSMTIERVKARLVQLTLVGFEVFFLIWFVCYLSSYRIIYLLFIFGLSGAFISIFQRIGKITNSKENTRNLITLVQAPFTLWFSLAFGMIFPLIAVLLICSGILHSSLFPRIHSVVAIAGTYSEFKADFERHVWDEIDIHRSDLMATTNGVDHKAPDHNSEKPPTISIAERSIPIELEHLGYLDFDKYFAELLVLAFFSGFSERFVTDAIDAFSRRLGKVNDKMQ